MGESVTRPLSKWIFLFQEQAILSCLAVALLLALALTSTLPSVVFHRCVDDFVIFLLGEILGVVCSPGLPIYVLNEGPQMIFGAAHQVVVNLPDVRPLGLGYVLFQIEDVNQSPRCWPRPAGRLPVIGCPVPRVGHTGPAAPGRGVHNCPATF